MKHKTSRKPKDTDFFQQRLSAWQPLLTPNIVIIHFMVFGIISVCIGAGLLVASQNVEEITSDYTLCKNTAGKFCAVQVRNNIPCQCNVEVTVSKNMNGPVFLYYGLENYYQNYRLYVRSRDDKQLRGEGVSGDYCNPLKQNDASAQYAPCGIIANSFFNDTFTVAKSADGTPVSLNSDNIAWKTDFQDKFRNPSGGFGGTVQPVYWTFTVESIPGSTGSTGNIGNGYENQDLINWMRTMASPDFRKLYRVVNGGLQPGTYTVTVDYKMRVDQWGGRKLIILSTTSFLGGKNDFLGIAFLTAGSLSIVIGLLFLGKQCLKPRRLGDPKLLVFHED